MEQDVTFTGFAAPFSMEANPVVVPPKGATATFHFNPVAVNTFTNTVIATGSAFGTDTLHIEGEGTLPGAELLADTLLRCGIGQQRRHGLRARCEHRLGFFVY